MVKVNKGYDGIPSWKKTSITLGSNCITLTTSEKWNVMIAPLPMLRFLESLCSLVASVVQYFSGETDEQPDACGSFVRLTWDDNSKLAGICKDWGLVSGKYFVGKWGHGEDQNRLYRFPVFRRNKYHLRVQLHNVDDLKKMECDDGTGTNDDTNGDFWKVFVR